MKDHYIRGVAGNSSVRFILVSSTELVEKARGLHNTSPVSTAALGRVLTATAMMGLMMKDKGLVSFQIKGSNLIRSIFASAWSDGRVKGYISDTEVHMPANERGKLDVGGAIGTDGEMIVIRDFGLKEPYVGRSALVSGEIAEDLVHFFANSEQQPSAIALGVNLNDDGTVRSAGGIMIQPLPDISEEELTALEKAVSAMRPMSEMVAEYEDTNQILDEILSEMKWNALDEGDVYFECDCSRDRIEKALISMGQEDLELLIEQDGKADVSCHFCNKSYHFTEEELKQIAAEAK